MSENPYQSPNSVEEPKRCPPIGCIAYAAAIAQQVAVMIGVMAVALLIAQFIWPGVWERDDPAVYLAPYYFNGSFLVAVGLGAFAARLSIRKARVRALRREKIEKERLRAIESAKQRHA